MRRADADAEHIRSHVHIRPECNAAELRIVARIDCGEVEAVGPVGSNVSSKVRSVSKAIGTTEFSIDAEGGLRDRLGDGYGNDALNMEKVRAYLRNARAALSVAEH